MKAESELVWLPSGRCLVTIDIESALFDLHVYVESDDTLIEPDLQQLNDAMSFVQSCEYFLEMGYRNLLE